MLVQKWPVQVELRLRPTVVGIGYSDPVILKAGK